VSRIPCHAPARGQAFFRLACDKALPAAALDDALVRPSLSTSEAAVAASGDVCFPSAFRWASALPAADFDVSLVDLLRRVLLALEAAFFPVTRFFVMVSPNVLQEVGRTGRASRPIPGWPT
jgi:hypothetical protein